MFVGRAAELKVLENAYASGKPELVVVYGRRRVGKSALIQRFLEGKPRVLAVEALEKGTTRTQLAHFGRRLGEHLGGMLPGDATFADWDRAFDYLTRAVVARSRGRVVIFLDELQWMAAGQSALVGTLKYYWDNHWKKHAVMLVLCGSISSFMIRHVVRSKALYGRTTVELNLKGLLPHEAFELLGGRRSAPEVLRYLLVYGGVPKYLEEIDLSRSFNENLNNACFSRNGSMVGEVEKIFHSQFRRPGTYFRIIRLLTDRLRSAKELAELTRLRSGGGLSGYIDNLLSADLVMSYVPFDKPRGEKSVKYALSDEFLAFYLKYMEPNRRLIETSRSSRVFETVTADSFEAWLGLAFERFCHKHAGYLAEKMGFSDQMLQAGPLFRRGDERFQVDLLYRRADKVIVLCEIKHTGNAVSAAVIPEVERKCRLLSLPRGHSLHRALISLHGPDEALAGSRYFDHVVTLDDMFRA